MSCLLFGFLLGLLALPTYVNGATCLENGRFYRDPDRPPAKTWTANECSKYFLCLEKEVFEFRCSQGLLFDVKRQICDFKSNVENCDLTAEASVPEPLLEDGDCAEGHLACADGTCLPEEYFCDGSVDCGDGSDEGHCDDFYDANAATPCNTTACRLPKCFCSKDGKEIPGGLDPLEVPQMVLLTFEDAINLDNFELYRNLLWGSNRRNPNGCPISATFFVSHQYNNYQQTQKIWAEGHEIAVHSITHRGPEDWWSQNATIEDFFDEMVGQANILHRFGGVKLADIRGMRVPFQKIGWNRQFLMAKEFGFLYDATILAPQSDTPLWPYTLDHKIPHKCGQNCPTRSYPGLWELVQNLLVLNDIKCSSLASCPSNLSSEKIYKILQRNFNRHYETNRAPFGLHLHSSWLKKKENFEVLKKFVDDVLDLSDVWFVTNSQAVDWMKNPTKLNRLDGFKDWNCESNQKRDLVCKVPNICKLYSQVFQQERLFYTCSDCPPKYPWIRNEFGLD